jgi:hypothetical protein
MFETREPSGGKAMRAGVTKPPRADNQDYDESKRFDSFWEKVAAGAIDGVNDVIPKYVPKGSHSWKAAATGIVAAHDDGDELPVWTPGFETSDYRQFHDAVREHRFVVTQKILAAHGVRLA